MAFEKELPEWKEKGVKPPQSKLDEGWKVQDKPPAAWLNWQMNSTYEALSEIQEKAAEKTDVANALNDAREYTDKKVKDIDLSKITPESIGAAKQTDLNAHVQDTTKHVTIPERNTWNAKETPEGAQAKANAAETNAKNASLPRTGGTISGNLAVTNALTVAGRNVMSELDSVKQSGNSAKQGAVDAIISKNVSASINDEWPTLHSKIRQIKSGILDASATMYANTAQSQTTSYTVHTVEAASKAFVSSTTRWSGSIGYGGNGRVYLVLKDAYGNEATIVGVGHDRSGTPMPFTQAGLVLNKKTRTLIWTCYTGGTSSDPTLVTSERTIPDNINLDTRIFIIHEAVGGQYWGTVYSFDHTDIQIEG
ncbi:hypothetical protein [Paenibacillus sp. S-12]|uniref:hypothetical protein n=1 Tax=Paenibacillus sp. S-12 TaxID=3031371 RepID=UPI0025A267D6|nr:hypothetical protein [Paenibacillus sp. S-12]